MANDQELDYEIRKYNCKYCGFVFEAPSRTTQTWTEPQYIKGEWVAKEGSRATTQIQCSWCENFLKTKEGELIGETVKLFEVGRLRAQNREDQRRFRARRKRMENSIRYSRL